MSHVDGFDDGVGYGVRGVSENHAVSGVSINGAGVYAASLLGDGVVSETVLGFGVYAETGRGTGVYGKSWEGVGVFGESRNYHGVYGWSSTGTGVRGESINSYGVYGRSSLHPAVYGEAEGADAVVGESDKGTGVRGSSIQGTAVYGYSVSGNGVYGGCGGDGYAAYLDGRVHIGGPLEKPGGSFKIDHPLDPANKYLHHSFVESPDMKNIYDGVVALDDKGEAEIELPVWFGTLNKEFRYQLTAIGAPGPNLYIAEEISEMTTNNSRFKIAGGTLGMKVSWQVTGIRNDPWANAHRINVEEDKPDRERGYYIHPDLYGRPAEEKIGRILFPQLNRGHPPLQRDLDYSKTKTLLEL